MANTTVIIPDVSNDFARVIRQLYRIYCKNIPCGANIDFSGSNKLVKIKYHDINPESLYEIVQEEKIREDLDVQQL